MKLGESCENFRVPPHPKSITLLEGELVLLVPLQSKEHALDLFQSGAQDCENKNWVYLPYGPFKDLKSYSNWIKEFEGSSDPVFFAIIRKRDNKAVGVASYLRIKSNDGTIEVGHINYSPLLQNTTEGTEAMYLMMRWAFENGYRRYEWKCNALNIKSRNAAQRLGLSYEGVFRQMAINKGRNRNTAWFAAIDKEWDDLKKCFEIYLSEDNFDTKGNPKTSLSSLTRPILYKIDNMEFS